MKMHLVYCILVPKQEAQTQAHIVHLNFEAISLEHVEIALLPKKKQHIRV